MSNQMLSNIIASSKLAPTMDLENSNDKVENMEPEAEQETSECYFC
jgi:TATA-box binding protein (TBP) (component of TFIID and TFIIIB)